MRLDKDRTIKLRAEICCDCNGYNKEKKKEIDPFRCFDCEKRQAVEKHNVQVTQKKFFQKRIDNHLCRRCGIPLPEGYTKQQCEVCLMKANMSQFLYNRNKKLIKEKKKCEES